MQLEVFDSEICPIHSLRKFADRFPEGKDALGCFHDLVLQRPDSTIEPFDVLDVAGIEASKSGLWALDDFRPVIDFWRICSKYSSREALEQAVLQGDYDCVAKAGEPVDIWLQEWNNMATVMNHGGGHRFAALWIWHQDHRESLSMHARVTRFQLNPKCVELAQTHQLWIVRRPEDVPWWVEALLGHGIEDYPNGHGRCYAYPRASLLEPLFARAFARIDLFDLSKFVLELEKIELG